MSTAGDGEILGPDGQPIRSATGGGGASSDAGSAGESEGGAAGEHEHALPEPSLTVHVFHLASQVAVALGEAENPVTGQREPDLRAAQFLIDLIAMLDEKTRGNRTPEEDEYLAGVLTNLRMAYVSKSG
ncbi:MAG: DUF1844 domain-containing protein [Planctomycetota bacterium]|jgi:hypothetical protein